MPKVSIIMPVYNGEKYLRTSIESVLSQSFSDFEFVVVDDGSIDLTSSIIESYQDDRIHYIRNVNHKGISYALNQGLSAAVGELILRMDADDTCAPQRVLQQVDYMNSQPEISICGSDTELIDADGKIIGYRDTKKGDQRIKIALLLGECSLAHPAVAIRKDFLTKNLLYYSTDYIHAEDYELWCRSSPLGTFENLPEPLVQYRHHKKSTSKAYHQLQRLSARRILVAHLIRMGITASPIELKCHFQFALNMEIGSHLPTKKQFIDWRNKLVEWNRNSKCFQQELFEHELEERFQEVLSKNGGLL